MDLFVQTGTERNTTMPSSSSATSTTRTVGRGGEYFRSRTMRKRLPAGVILFVMFFGVCAAHAQRVPESSNPLTHGSHVALPPEKAHAVVIPRFEKPPVIDGKLDDECWKQAAVLKDFYQVQPGDNNKPTTPPPELLETLEGQNGRPDARTPDTHPSPIPS